jgi:glycerol uptake facilitator-like aquaporin
MEVKGGHQLKGWVLLFEFIGTANLLYAINTSTEGGMAPWGAGLTIMGNICMFGYVTGGHFNPAITLAVLIAEGSEKFGQNILYALMIMTV